MFLRLARDNQNKYFAALASGLLVWSGQVCQIASGCIPNFFVATDIFLTSYC